MSPSKSLEERYDQKVADSMLALGSAGGTSTAA
mgnify:CR=1 FL=1